MAKLAALLGSIGGIVVGVVYIAPLLIEISPGSPPRWGWPR